jgi:hypothetical protein
MTRGMDNDEWLKRIGAVTVDEDDLDGDLTEGEAPEPDLPGDDHDVAGETQLAPHGSYDIAEEVPLGSDDEYGTAEKLPVEADYGTAEEAPFDSRDDYEDHRHDLFLGAPLGGGEPVANVDRDSEVSIPGSAHETPRRFTPWVLAAFGAAAVIGTTITLVFTMANSSSTEPAKPSAAPVAPRVVEVAPPSPPPNTDGPLPFTASSDCPPGSTAAQTVADPNSTTPWVCVRSVDGQVLEIDLGRTFVITAVSIVPGAVNKTDTSPDQPDPWLQHRVVTRVQWQFNDTDRTVKNQNTGNVRGEAVEPIRPGVLASKITVIIQETSRPPAIAPTGPAAPPTPGAKPSILGDILGGNQDLGPAPVPVIPGMGGADRSRDPADGTFAVSSIKIIGHKAV